MTRTEFNNIVDVGITEQTANQLNFNKRHGIDFLTTVEENNILQSSYDHAAEILAEEITRSIYDPELAEKTETEVRRSPGKFLEDA